jgi:hypothetical protein
MTSTSCSPIATADQAPSQRVYVPALLAACIWKGVADKCSHVEFLHILCWVQHSLAHRCPVCGAAARPELLTRAELVRLREQAACGPWANLLAAVVERYRAHTVHCACGAVFALPEWFG